MERDEFVERVLEVVEQIPPGRVMAYGEVAEYVGAGGPRARTASGSTCAVPDGTADELGTADVSAFQYPPPRLPSCELDQSCVRPSRRCG